MRYFTFVFFLSVNIPVQAQTTYNKFQWQDKPVIHAISGEFEEAASVYVNDDRIVEYIIEKDGFFIYRTVHRIVHINNDKGIENFNKIYLPFGDGLDMPDVKARTILPGGKIIEMDKKNIKDIKDEDGQYKIFALEGLTRNCEVEYYFTVKMYPSFFGREIMSSSIPVEKANFELISPEHLAFEVKSYNGFPAPADTSYGEKRYLLIETKKIKEAVEEKYSMYNAGLQRVEYKLSYNKLKNARERLFTWDELAKKAYDIYNKVDDKEAKKIKDLLSGIGIKPNAPQVEKIVNIENYLKKNFIVRDDISSDDANDLGKVIKNKISSEKALCKLFVALFNQANIEYQIVLCGDRSDYTVDRSFENWNNAKNFLLYFPSLKKFIAPTEIAYRYPWIPPTWAATNGLFCVGTSIGSFTTAVAEIRSIAMEAYEHTFVNMDVSLKLDRDDTLLAEVKQSYGGYAAPNYKAPFVFLPADEQNKALKDIVKFGTNSENIVSHSFENKEIEEADPYKPFVINASVKTPNLVERGGDKLLIKIGEVIGRQVEMYDAKPRTADVDIIFPHSLIRNIELTIPDGYKVKNLNDLNFNQVYKENDIMIMGFICSYVQKGNILNITVKEEYKNLFYPLKQYEAFKKVINASADFNKVLLVLDKN